MRPNENFAAPLLALISIVSIGSFAQGCSSSPSGVTAGTDTHAADEAAIRANSIAWSAAVTAKNRDKALSFYADDAIAFDPGRPPQTTRAERQAGWDRDLPDPNSSLSWKTTKVEVAKSGEIAYEYGAYEYVTAEKNGSKSTLHGKYVLVWKKQSDGAWKVAIDIDNKDSDGSVHQPVLPDAKSANERSPMPAAQHH